MRIQRGSSPRVLVVEDDDLLRKVLCQTIQRIGFVPFPCSDGDAGFETLLNQEVDIVVSDIMMPGMTGLELLQKASGAGMQQPFIIVSSQNKRDILMQALKLGAFDFIDKPFQASVISQVLDEAFRYSQRLGQFARDLKLEDLSQASSAEKETIKAHYLLRLIEATVNPFGGANPGAGGTVADILAQGRSYYFATAAKALSAATRRMQGLSKFDSSSWDIGVILRTIHSVKMAGDNLLRSESKALLEAMENSYALLRLYREFLSKEVFIVLQTAHDVLEQVLAAETIGGEIPDTAGALEGLEKFEIKVSKAGQSALS